METNIINQHYVWRHYLKPWLTNGKIWCARDNKLFKRNVEKLTTEKYFYKAEPLNINEKKIIQSIIDSMDSSGHDLLHNTFSIYNEASNGSTFEKNNSIESYHSIIEQCAILILDCLYNNNFKFLENDLLKTIFATFIATQYTRTKKVRDNLTKAFHAISHIDGYPKNINTDKISSVLALILSESISNWVFTNAKFSILENKSSIGFLTSDQPIYNLHANTSEKLAPVNDFELFYPITPQKALILKKELHDEKDVDINYYNNFIIRVTKEYIFSKEKEELQYYLKNNE